MGRKFGILAALALAVCARIVLAAGTAVQPIPELVARVTDATSTLTAQQESALGAKLAALEQRKGAQIAVLIVATTSPETIEQYATRVFDAWKLGRKGVDDGVLILVAKDDRRERIEVAYGLEGAIPDAAAKRVAHDYMSPKFRTGDFAGGIDAGVDMLTRLIDEEPLPPPPAQDRAPSRGHAIPEPWWSPVQFVGGMLLGAVLAVLLVLVLAWPRNYRAVLGRIPERARSYVFGAIVAVPMTLLLRHPMASFGAFAAGGTLAAMLGLSKPPTRRPRGFADGGGGSSSGSSGGSSSSSDSGSSSSGSDFSGGGGSSGGGGASDSW